MRIKMENHNSKRLVKNTLLLYVRTIIVMCVGLYTSRVILDVLGIEDYGIYNVVGGFVVMFSIFSASLSNSITRYITFELGCHNMERLRTVFSMSLNIQIIISLIIVLLVELVGVWFLNYRLNIPSDRLYAANWVMQFSLFTFVVNLISLPYNALIVAYEKMDVFAYISLLEASLKLGVVYLLFISPIDKLIFYAFLLALVSLLIRLIYGCYCTHKFTECRYVFVLKKSLLKNMLGFAGWNFLGTTAYLIGTNGVDILSNMFFGIMVNASRGIASQAGNAVRQFVNNFTTALNPQIIKTYADNNLDICFSTVRQGAKYSYCLMLFFFIPFVLEANYILHLWLKEFPDQTVVFWQLTMLGILVDLPGAPLTILAQAIGHIRRYYIYMSLIGALVFPISYFLFYLGWPAYSAYVTYIVVYTCLVYVRLILMNKQIGFPINIFLKQVIWRIVFVTVLSFILPIILINIMDEGFLRLISVGVVSTLSLVVSMFYIGMQKSERVQVIGFIRNKLYQIYSKE